MWLQSISQRYVKFQEEKESYLSGCNLSIGIINLIDPKGFVDNKHEKRDKVIREHAKGLTTLCLYNRTFFLFSSPVGDFHSLEIISRKEADKERTNDRSETQCTTRRKS